MEVFSNKKLLREHLVSLTKDLISFPSHPDEPAKIFELIEFIKAYFKKEKVQIASFISDGYPSLVITLQETKHPDILLSGHIDVVSSSNCYSAIVEDEWLYGSGALDMKGGVAVMMAILKYFSRTKKPPSLGIMLTSDEEIGSENGTKMLLEQESYRANFAIINEGRREYQIVVKEKGVLTLKLVSHGDFIHSAYPWLGKNALEELIAVFIRIKKMFPKPADAWIPTASITVLHGGKEENTIPGQVSGVINMRLTGGKHWSKEAVMAKIQKILPKTIEIVESSYGDIFRTDERNAHLRLLRKVAQKVVGRSIRYTENHGSSDAKTFMNHGIPLAILGPVGKNHHSPQEVLKIESMMDHFEVLKRFIELEREFMHKISL